MAEQPGSRTPRDGGAETESPPFAGLKGWLKTIMRAKNADSVRDAIEELIEEEGEQAQEPMDAYEKRLIGNVLHLCDLTASDLMAPRADIVGISADASLDEVTAILSATRHSRYPVFQGTMDGVIGVIHIKDVLLALMSDGKFSLTGILRTPLYVAPSIRVLDLLLEMRQKRNHMALVIDEYGGIDGLVTIEDLIEQIVGEIEDEHDEESDLSFVENEEGLLEADGRMALSALEERVGSLLDERDREDIDTLGGLVSFLAGRVPGHGELITHPKGMEFEILDADPRRVKKIRIRPAPQKSEHKG